MLFMEEGNRTCRCVPAGTNPYASSMNTPILTESTASRNHPEPAELQRFLRGEASRDEVRAIVRHLLAGCPECTAVMGPTYGLAKRWPKALPAGKRTGRIRLEREAVGEWSSMPACP